METIKITVRESVEKEVEIKLPLFRKNQATAYMVFSDKKCISVTHHAALDPQIQIAHFGLAFQLEETKDCTEEEFRFALNEAMDRLKNHLSKTIIIA